jgi:hypothetical protein
MWAELTTVVRRAIRLGVALTAIAAAVSVALGGGRVALGVILGGAICLANLGWLDRDVARLADVVRGGGRRLRWPVLGLRQLLVFAVLGAALVAGWPHPVGIAIGVAVLPVALAIEGLRASRDIMASTMASTTERTTKSAT